MSANIIDGKKIATEIKHTVQTLIEKKRASGERPPGLAVILVGNDPASEIYVKNKNAACEQVGIYSEFHKLPSDIPQQDLMAMIQTLNQDANIDGILLQLPLPSHINSDQMLECIDPRKDIDGFHPYNIGRLAQRSPLLRPCTPFGIMQMLKSIKQPFKQKHAVVVGASNIVGRPMAMELLIAGSTVTICHRFTHELNYFVAQADILIAAVGKPGIIRGEWIKPGATVIDVGMNRLADGSLTGDVEFDIAKQRAAWITPVPGGVGPMTVAMLLVNTLFAAGYDLSNLFSN